MCRVVYVERCFFCYTVSCIWSPNFDDTTHCVRPTDSCALHSFIPCFAAICIGCYAVYVETSVQMSTEGRQLQF